MLLEPSVLTMMMRVLTSPSPWGQLLELGLPNPRLARKIAVEPFRAIYVILGIVVYYWV